MESDTEFQSLAPADRRLTQELVFGVLRQRSLLDWLVARRTDGRPQRPELAEVLRLGLYQLFFLDRVPSHAAVHETVELARQAGFPHQSGFVNAVLRGCDRDRPVLRQEIERLRDTDPATAFSHPRWLVDRWRVRYGRDGLRRLLEWDNSAPSTFARVNTLRVPVATLLEKWKAEGVVAEPSAHDWVPEGLAWKLVSHPSLATLASFTEGGFYIQDPSTLLAVTALEAAPGMTVLDYCAAPGGKTTFIAQRMEDRGTVVAHDANDARLRLVTENCRRLGVGCVRTVVAPAAPAAPGSFDRVLVDAPCSNTGVLRRRLELRWRIRPEEIGRLASTQCEILGRAGPYVKPGGLLVYSTCSLESEENEAVIQAFASGAGGGSGRFSIVSQRQVGPVEAGVDGAFVAVLRREG